MFLQCNFSKFSSIVAHRAFTVALVSLELFRGLLKNKDICDILSSIPKKLPHKYSTRGGTTNGTSIRQRFHKKKKKKVIGSRANEPTIGSLVRFLLRAPCFFPNHQRLNTHANHWHLFPTISRMYQFGFFLGDCLYRR